MDDQLMLNFLTGPVSALALALTILWGLGKFASRYLPQIVDKHLKQIDNQMVVQEKICDRLDQIKDQMAEQHSDQTEIVRKAISGIHGRLNPMETDLKDIKATINAQTNT